MSITTVSYSHQTNNSKNQYKDNFISKEQAKEILERDYSANFPENVQELVKKLYSKRNEKGESIENITQTWRRVALSVGLARLKYVLKPHELIQLTLERALDHPAVLS